MADLQHDVLTTAQVHEPKHITGGSTGDSGKVITNSASVAGQSEYRLLKSSDISETDVFITGYERDSTLAEETFFICPVNGTIETISLVISDALVTADNIYTIDIAGLAPTPLTLTAIQAGSAKGDIFTVTMITGTAVNSGDVIKLTSSGGNTDAAVGIWFQLEFRRL